MRHVASRTKKHKTSLLKAIEKKTGIPQNVLVTFVAIVAVFVVMTLSYEMSPYKAVHALIFTILALPPVLLSFIISTTFWLPTQHAFDLFFWPLAMLYWPGISFAVHAIYGRIKCGVFTRKTHFLPY